MTGFVILRRGGLTRRIPFWTRIERPQLGAPVKTLTHAGRYSGDTRRGKARVSSYRYPDDPRGVGVSNDLPGPEQVFRVRIGSPVANFGVRVVSQGKGVVVTPRIVAAGDENRLAGVPALPFDVNPYRDSYGDPRAVVGRRSCRPAASTTSSSTRARAPSPARSAFRLWLNDTTPPRSRLRTPSVPKNGSLVVSVVDGGSGVDPRSLDAFVDGRRLTTTFSSGKARVLLERAVRARTAHARLPGVRLPGVEELGEHRRAPAEHLRPSHVVRRALDEKRRPR